MDMLSDHHRPVVRESSTYLTDSEAASVCTLFGDGLESGMSYARIVDMLERQGYENKIVQRLRKSLMEEGNMLGEAFARFGILDATSRKLIYVSEQQGKLPETFKDLSRFYENRHRRRRRLVLSFVEPAILIMLGLILARNIFTADIEELTASTAIFENLQPLLIKSLIESAIFSALSFLAGLVYLNLPVDFPLRDRVHRAWLLMPLATFNEASRLNSVAVFCRYSEQSISSGLTVHRALALAAEASNNPRIDGRIAIAQRAIEEGRTLAAGLYEMGTLPNEVIEYIDIGEEAGRLEERLEELADRFDERAAEAFENGMKAFIYVMRTLVIITVIVMLLFTLGEFFTANFDF